MTENNTTSKKGNIEDGIIDKETYNKQDTKILFILKEAYDKTPDGEFTKKGEWSLPQLIMTMISDFTLTKIQTFNSLFLFASQLYKYGNIDVLKRIAYINVKKTSGTTRSSDTVISSTLQKNIDALNKQIEDIAPHIIIFGSILIADKFQNLWDENLCDPIEGGCNYFFHNDILCIYSHHPSYHEFTKTCIPQILEVLKANDKLPK